MSRLTISLGVIFLTAAGLGACASAPPVDGPVKVQTVDIPVPAPCAPNLGREPAYPDTDQALAAAPDLFIQVKLLLAGRTLRIARDAQKTAALAACAGPSQGAP